MRTINNETVKLAVANMNMSGMKEESVENTERKFVRWENVSESFENLEGYLKSMITYSFVDMGIVDENTLRFVDQKCICGRMVDGHVGVCECGRHVSYRQVMAMKMIREQIKEDLNNMWNSSTKRGTLLIPGTDQQVSVQEAAAIQGKVFGSKIYNVVDSLFYSNRLVKEAVRLQTAYHVAKEERKRESVKEMVVVSLGDKLAENHMNN